MQTDFSNYIILSFPGYAVYTNLVAYDHEDNFCAYLFFLYLHCQIRNGFYH